MSALCFLSELYTLMKDQDDGVRELKLEQENRVFNHCFTGTVVLVLLMLQLRKKLLFLSCNGVAPSIFFAQVQQWWSG